MAVAPPALSRTSTRSRKSSHSRTGSRGSAKSDFDETVEDVLARVGETVDSIVKLADKTFVRLVSKTIEDVQSSRKQKEAERIQKEEQARKARAEEEERQYRASRMDDEVLLVSLDSTAFRMKLRDLPSDVPEFEGAWRVSPLKLPFTRDQLALLVMTRDEQRNYIIHWIHGRMGGLQDVLHIARFYKRMLLDQHLDRLLRTVAQAVRRLHVSPLFYFGVVSGLEDWDAWGGLRGWPHALGEETHIDLDAAEIDELGKVVPQIWIDALQLSVAEWDPTSMKRHYEDLRSTC